MRLRELCATVFHSLSKLSSSHSKISTAVVRAPSMALRRSLPTCSALQARPSLYRHHIVTYPYHVCSPTHHRLLVGSPPPLPLLGVERVSIIRRWASSRAGKPQSNPSHTQPKQKPLFTPEDTSVHWLDAARRDPAKRRWLKMMVASGIVAVISGIVLVDRVYLSSPEQRARIEANEAQLGQRLAEASGPIGKIAALIGLSPAKPNRPPPMTSAEHALQSSTPPAASPSALPTLSTPPLSPLTTPPLSPSTPTLIDSRSASTATPTYSADRHTRNPPAANASSG